MRRETAHHYLTRPKRSFGAGKPHDVSCRRLARKRRFVDVRSGLFMRQQLVERNPDLLQHSRRRGLREARVYARAGNSHSR